MNKYSSKAVKTAATVGMSLAMVLSAVPAVGNTTNVQAKIENVTSTRATAAEAHKILAKVLEKMTDYAEFYGEKDLAEKTIVEIQIGDKTSDPNYYVQIAVNTKFSTLRTVEVTNKKSDNSAAKDTNGIGDETTLEELANYLVTNSYAMDEADVNEDVVAFAKFIKGYAKATATEQLGGYFGSGDLNSTTNKGTVITAVASNGVTDNATEALAAYKVVTDNEKYLNAMIDPEKRDTVLTTIANFKAEVESYKAEKEDVFVSDYVRELEKIELITDVKVYDAVEKGASIPYTNLATVEKVLKDIKGNNYKKLTDIAKYADVKEAEEVANYIDGLETIVSEMKEVKELLKNTNADVKAYKKDLKTKVDNLSAAANAYLTEGDAVQKAAAEVVLEQKLNAFREADVTALTKFVEDYIGNFYTLTPKKLNSGKYVVRLENADYGRYVTKSNVFGLIDSTGTKGLEYLLTTTIDSDTSAETYYDTLSNAVTTVEALLKAVTTDIEGITMGSTLTDKQAAKIVAAKKALNQLVDKDGKISSEYAGALTSKEKKAVLANVDTIETLYLKLILNGNVSTTGWVDKGNGNWDYIAEDGSRPTKWIASGSNWYYVKNGTMLRNSWIASDAQGTRWYYVDDNGVMVSNTTVNGYTFNSYGVWVK